MMIKSVTRAILFFIAIVLVSSSSFAEQYPSRPIRILVGFNPGGATDIVARLYAEKLREILGATVIVENKPGASQLIAMRQLMSSPPDGYTLCLATVSILTQAPAFRTSANFDPLKDFTPIAMIATVPGIFIVDPKLNITSMSEFISKAKANPNTFQFSTAGIGSGNHVQLEYFKHATGIEMQDIPYKSDQEATFEVANGRVNLSMTVASFALPLVLDGKLRAIGVSSGNRLSSLPDVPTLTELGIPGLEDITYLIYYGLIAPRGLAPQIAQRLNMAVNEASGMPDVAGRMKDTLSMDVISGTPDSFHAFLANDLKKWKRMQAETGLKF